MRTAKLTGAGTGAPNNRLVNSTLAGYSPPVWPPAPTTPLTVQIDCEPSGRVGYLACYAYASGGTGGGYEFTWMGATGSGGDDYARVQCPYGSSAVDVYVTVLDSGGNGANAWKAAECSSGY